MDGVRESESMIQSRRRAGRRWRRTASVGRLRSGVRGAPQVVRIDAALSGQESLRHRARHLAPS